MNKFTIYLEIDQVTDSKINFLVKREDLYSILKDCFIGATIEETLGLWDKKLNNAFKIEVIDVKEEKIKAFCQAVKVKFNQESILYIKEDVKSNFV